MLRRTCANQCSPYGRAAFLVLHEASNKTLTSFSSIKIGVASLTIANISILAIQVIDSNYRRLPTSQELHLSLVVVEGSRTNLTKLWQNQPQNIYLKVLDVGLANCVFQNSRSTLSLRIFPTPVLISDQTVY